MNEIIQSISLVFTHICNWYILQPIYILTTQGITVLIIQCTFSSHVFIELDWWRFAYFCSLHFLCIFLLQHIFHVLSLTHFLQHLQINKAAESCLCFMILMILLSSSTINFYSISLCVISYVVKDIATGTIYALY